MANEDSTVKISKWLLDEIETFVNRNRKNKTAFPSKRNFVDRAVLNFLELNGAKVS